MKTKTEQEMEKEQERICLDIIDFCNKKNMKGSFNFNIGDYLVDFEVKDKLLTDFDKGFLQEKQEAKKEFIRRLKENMERDRDIYKYCKGEFALGIIAELDSFKEIIDKLAGDKLI